MNMLSCFLVTALPFLGASGQVSAEKSKPGAQIQNKKLGLDQPTGPLLDQILGPAKPVKEVLDELERHYREEGKPAVWFLPLDEPISPHLDELLGKPPE
jgi:hypothetical protein